MLGNASYLAFTATPKNKTLETFGIPYQDGDDIKHRPFHVYMMKQAIANPYGLSSQEHKAIIYDFDPRQKTRMVAEEPTIYRKKKE